MERPWRTAIVKSCRIFVGVVTLSMALTACDDSAPAMLNPGGPSTSQMLAASMSVYPGTAQSGYQNAGCQVVAQVPVRVNVLLTSSQNVDLNSVTIQMLDGTHLGGPIVTIPQQQLNTQFGTTQIVAGAPRTFVFDPMFPCAGVPHSVVADISFLDHQGLPHSVRVSTPWP
jgi:hypothetical protein